MKRLVGITGIILMLCLFIGVYFAPQGLAESYTEATVSSYGEIEVYIIKSEDNRLVVYKKGENAPFLTTDTQTDSLPKSDKLQLSKGIEIKGEKNLKKSLEDYCS